MLHMNTKSKSFRGMILVGILITLGLRIPYLNFAALILSAYYLATFNKEEILYFLMFLFPFAPIFKLTIGSISFFTFLPMIAVIKLLWAAEFKISKNYGLPLIMLSLYSVFCSISTDLVECITMLLSLLMAALFLHSADSEYSFKRVVEYNVLGIVFTSVIALCSSIFPRITPIIDQTRVKLGAGIYFNRFAGLMENPNYYTMMVSVALAALCVLIIQRKMSALDYGFFVLLSVFGLMSVSKSFIITYIAMMFLLFVFFLKEKPKFLVANILLFCVMGMIIYNVMGSDVITTILFRFNADKANDLASITTGRSVFWTEYLEFWWDNPMSFMTGLGIGASNLNGHASHNFYLEIIYYLGAIGGSIYVLCLSRIFMSNKFNVRRNKAYCFLPLIVFLIRGMARNIILSEQLVFLLIICTLSLTSEAEVDTVQVLSEVSEET